MGEGKKLKKFKWFYYSLPERQRNGDIMYATATQNTFFPFLLFLSALKLFLIRSSAIFFFFFSFSMEIQESRNKYPRNLAQ